MFTLHKDAKFQGYTKDGMAVYAVDGSPVAKTATSKLDPAKLAKARADRDAINAMLPK